MLDIILISSWYLLDITLLFRVLAQPSQFSNRLHCFDLPILWSEDRFQGAVHWYLSYWCCRCLDVNPKDSRFDARGSNATNQNLLTQLQGSSKLLFTLFSSQGQSAIPYSYWLSHTHTHTDAHSHSLSPSLSPHYVRATYREYYFILYDPRQRDIYYLPLWDLTISWVTQSPPIQSSLGNIVIRAVQVHPPPVLAVLANLTNRTNKFEKNQSTINNSQ